MPAALFTLNGASEFDPAVEEWLSSDPALLYGIARKWFGEMRACGDDVRELMHDGHATACVGDAAFAYVAVFSKHINVGFFAGADLQDPAGLLQGSGKRMRHVKLHPGEDSDDDALVRLIRAAYRDVSEKLRKR
ncbi:MAG: DUF1801 domain-containing protein [Gammaproteobacteria bacterium]